MWYACAIVPEGGFADDLDELPFEMAQGVRIERVPDWLKVDEVLKSLSWRDREGIKGAELAFAAEYEAEALGSPDPQWLGRERRSIQSSIDEKFSLAAVCCWLVRPTPFSAGPLLHFGENGDAESLRTAGSLRKILVREYETEDYLSSEDLRAASVLLESMLAVERKGSLWIAVRMLARALTEMMWEARYVWQWVVLEALFGPSNAGETTYRLSQRIAIFLGEDAGQRSEVYTMSKSAYAQRSKIVHGTGLGKLTPDKADQLTVFTEATVRAALTRILRDGELTLQFTGNARDRYLDNMVLGQ